MLERLCAITPTIRAKNIKETLKIYKDKRIWLIVFNSEIESVHITTKIVLSKTGDIAEAASNIYSALHTPDEQNLDIIIAEEFPDYGLGKSINDRLEHATK